MKHEKIISIGNRKQRESASRFTSMADLVEYGGDEMELLLDFGLADPAFQSSVWAQIEAECAQHQINPDDIFIYLHLRNRDETFLAFDHPIGSETYHIPIHLTRRELNQAVKAHMREYMLALIRTYDIRGGDALNSIE